MADYTECRCSIIIFSGFSGPLWRYPVVIRYTGVTTRTPAPYGHRNGWSPEGPAPRGSITPGRPGFDGSSMLSSPQGRTTPVRPPQAPPRDWGDSATGWRIAVPRFSTLRRRPGRPQRPPAGDGSVPTEVRSMSGARLPRPGSSGSTRPSPCPPTTIEPDVRLQLTSEFPSLPTVQRVLPARVAAVGGDETDHHAGSDHQPVRVGVVHTPRTTAMTKPFPLATGRDSRVDRAGSSGEGYPAGAGDVTRERECGQGVNSDGSRGPPRGVDRDEAARRAAMRKGLTVRAVLRL